MRRVRLNPSPLRGLDKFFFGDFKGPTSHYLPSVKISDPRVGLKLVIVPKATQIGYKLLLVVPFW